MSLIGLYSVRDLKLGEFGNVIQHKTDADAVRSLTKFVNSGADHVMVENPADFQLYFLCSYDPESGAVESPPLPRHVVDAVSLIIPDNIRE